MLYKTLNQEIAHVIHHPLSPSSIESPIQPNPSNLFHWIVSTEASTCTTVVVIATVVVREVVPVVAVVAVVAVEVRDLQNGPNGAVDAGVLESFYTFCRGRTPHCFQTTQHDDLRDGEETLLATKSSINVLACRTMS